VLWVLVSLSAGICEEFVFRGYLMRPVRGLARVVAGRPFASAVFRDRHAYEGLGPVPDDHRARDLVRLVALSTRRLVPGMAAHALEDIVAGLSLAAAQQRRVREQVVLRGPSGCGTRVPPERRGPARARGTVVEVVGQDLEARTLEQAALERAAAVGSTAEYGLSAGDGAGDRL
jgi:hypothetical protein